MKFLLLLLALTVAPTPSFAVENTKETLYEFCLKRWKATPSKEAVCVCMTDKTYARLTQHALRMAELAVKNLRTKQQRMYSKLLSDPALNDIKINRFCEISDRYDAMIGVAPAKPPRSPESLAHARKSSNILKEMHAEMQPLHMTYQTTSKSMNMLGGYYPGKPSLYCRILKGISSKELSLRETESMINGNTLPISLHGRMFNMDDKRACKI